MKIKKVRIIVRDVEEIKKEWVQALQGKKTTGAHPHDVIIVGFKTLEKIFSQTRMEVFKAIINQKPHSIYELAKMVKRDFKNVYADVKLLCQLGLIELQEIGHARGRLVPMALFNGIELDLAA